MVSVYERVMLCAGPPHGVKVKRSAVQVFCRRHGIRPYRPSYRFLRGDPGKQRDAASGLAALKKGHWKAGWSF